MTQELFEPIALGLLFAAVFAALIALYAASRDE
jgi:hypothetical protein